METPARTRGTATSAATCRNDAIGSLGDAVHPHPALSIVAIRPSYSARTSAQRREAELSIASELTRTFPDTKRCRPRHRGLTTSVAHVREVP